MKSKGLIGLLIATAAAVVLAVLLSSGSGVPAVDPQSGKAVLPDLAKHLDSIARVTLVRGESKTTLLRQDKDWVVEEKGGYPADTDKVRQALLGLAELSYVEPKTKRPDSYPRLQVEDAGQKDAKSVLVTASDDKGDALGEIIAGKRRIDQLGGGVDGIYVRKPGDAQSWLARGTLDVAGDTSGWLDRKIIDLPQEKVKDVVLTQPDGGRLHIARDKPEDALALKDVSDKDKPKSDTALVEPAGALAALDLADVRAAADMPLPKEGVARAEFTSFDGLAVKVSLFQQDGKDWARFETSGTGDAEKQAVELNAKLSRWVYAIPDYKAKTLKTKLADVVAPPKPS
ncbi:MAG TPA: DUF4340 domain-containing protein [Stellaceae bacterium]